MFTFIFIESDYQSFFHGKSNALGVDKNFLNKSAINSYNMQDDLLFIVLHLANNY